MDEYWGKWVFVMVLSIGLFSFTFKVDGLKKKK